VSIMPPGSESNNDSPAGMKPGDIVLVDLEHGSIIGTALIVGTIHVYVADGNGTCDWYRREDVSAYVEPEDSRQELMEEAARWLLSVFGMGLTWDGDATPELREIFLRRAGQLLSLPRLQAALCDDVR
jgi:hypothetical protein